MLCCALAHVLVTKLKRAKAHAGLGASIFLSLIVGGLLLIVAAVLEPIAFAVHFQNVDVMGQAIEQRAGRDPVQCRSESQIRSDCLC